MKLKLKHLAPYLPYSVKIEHPTLMNGKRKISELYSIKEFILKYSIGCMLKYHNVN